MVFLPAWCSAHERARAGGPSFPAQERQPNRYQERAQLWILGEDDVDAPSAETVRRLETLAAEGRPIATAVFPHTEHGIYEYETTADGRRVATRNPAGYFAMMRDFIRSGRLERRYGSSIISGAIPK